MNAANDESTLERGTLDQHCRSITANSSFSNWSTLTDTPIQKASTTYNTYDCKFIQIDVSDSLDNDLERFGTREILAEVLAAIQ